MSPTCRSTSGNSQRPDAINAYKYGCRVKNPFLRFSSQVRRSFEGDRAAARQDQFSGQLHPLEKRRGRPKSPRTVFLARESVDHAEGARQSMCSRRPSRPLGASVVARHEQAREAAVEALPRSAVAAPLPAPRGSTIGSSVCGAARRGAKKMVERVPPENLPCINAQDHVPAPASSQKCGSHQLPPARRGTIAPRPPDASRTPTIANSR